MRCRPTSSHEVARAEGPRGEVLLRSREESGATPVLELRVNGVFVMDTRETGTERALATLALAEVDSPRRVVIGGLGLGFTLHEVLADPRVEHVAVVEIEEALVLWMRNGTVPHGPGFLADQRVRVVEADFALAVAEAPRESYDLVLLDVDNGPDQLVHTANERLYTADLLADVRRMLAPGGALAVWSAGRAPSLLSTLGEVFDDVEERSCPVTLQERPDEYWLYLARLVSRA
ncbi:MAG: hypothetical protein Q8Q02_05150 [Nocardioides sp.]|nr:hypothetical protein [Nocardioides sp.]